jgi:Domain of Unknown Function (DUF1206)
MPPDPCDQESEKPVTSTGTRHVTSAANNKWAERLTRVGLGARGVLYIVIAILAFRVALGHYEDQASQNGALNEIASKPGGQVLVWIIAVGLIAYSLWRLLSAAFGGRVDPIATDAKQRVKALAEGIGYGSIAVVAVKVAVGSGSSSGGGGGQQKTAMVLGWPGGQFLVGLVGVIALGVGTFFVHDGVKAEFTKELTLGGLSPTARKAVVTLGRAGRIAQGIVFGIIGVLIITAAVQYDPDQAKGLDGALKSLVGQPYGRVLLCVVAIGLLAYGLYGVAESRLRKV